LFSDHLQPEDSGNKLLQNSGNYLPVNLESYPRRLKPSSTPVGDFKPCLDLRISIITYGLMLNTTHSILIHNLIDFRNLSCVFECVISRTFGFPLNTVINTDTHVLLWSNVEQTLHKILQYVSLSFLFSVKANLRRNSFCDQSYNIYKMQKFTMVIHIAIKWNVLSIFNTGTIKIYHRMRNE